MCRAAGCSARASELSNLAPRLRPARRTVAGWCPDMCELVWGEPGTFVKERRVRRKQPPLYRCERWRLEITDFLPLKAASTDRLSCVTERGASKHLDVDEILVKSAGDWDTVGPRPAAPLSTRV